MNNYARSSSSTDWCAVLGQFVMFFFSALFIISMLMLSLAVGGLVTDLAAAGVVTAIWLLCEMAHRRLG